MSFADEKSIDCPVKSDEIMESPAVQSVGLGTKCIHSGYRPNMSQMGSVMPPLYMSMNFERGNRLVSFTDPGLLNQYSLIRYVLFELKFGFILTIIFKWSPITLLKLAQEYNYSRNGNPNRSILESKLADMEGSSSGKF